MTDTKELSARQALALATPLPLAEAVVTRCIPSKPPAETGEQKLSPAETAFTAAFAPSLREIPLAQRRTADAS